MFESIAYAQQAGGGASGAAPSPLISFLPLILIFLIFYVLLIRPQNKKEAERKKMIDGIQKNDEIVTIGGIHGTIVNLKDDVVTVRVDEKVRIDIDRSAVSRVEKNHNKDN
ncbi:MAG: preprotein translocase subunit YajC [Candidatus Omnitrophica bacterium]|nr:preprotein translocase subunit YajC [Candidatus Omnitrophota bacterium]